MSRVIRTYKQRQQPPHTTHTKRCKSNTCEYLKNNTSFFLLLCRFFPSWFPFPGDMRFSSVQLSCFFIFCESTQTWLSKPKMHRNVFIINPKRGVRVSFYHYNLAVVTCDIRHPTSSPPLPPSGKQKSCLSPRINRSLGRCLFCLGGLESVCVSACCLCVCSHKRHTQAWER